ncbi:MAG TPA: DnaA/Hda family protein [Phycisphaerales bacterium]|nr:DnaA/Hda family protein [Phycisphaerales bacterium]
MPEAAGFAKGKAAVSDADSRLRSRLREQLGDDRYERYFGRDVRFECRDGEVEVAVATPFLAKLLDRRVGESLRRAAEAEGGTRVRVRVDRDAFEHAGADRVPERSGDRHGRRQLRPSAKRRPAGVPGKRLEDFVVGESNRLAYNASLSLAGGGDGARFSPLFIHGASGMGKTHLLQGIVGRVQASSPGARVIVTTAESFMNDYVVAVKTNSLGGFRRRWRGVELLCLDDVHFLSSKQGTQSELLHTFDAIDLTGARVALASDEHPHRIDRLSAQLRSRFLSGAVVRLDSPDADLRRRLVAAFAARRGIALEEEAVRLIVERSGLPAGSPASVRDIEGMVTQVEAVSRLLPEFVASGGGIGALAVRRALGLGEPGCESVSRRSLRPIRPEAVVRGVAGAMGVEVSEVLGPSRHRRVVLARALCVYLMRELTTLSYPEIGRALARRNHSTAATADKRLRGQIAEGEAVSIGSDLDGLTIVEVVERVRMQVIDIGARSSRS